MSYQLYHKDGEYSSWGQGLWPQVVDLAKAYGWEHEGTTLTAEQYGADPSDWPGTYTSNDSQLVSDDDAVRLAEALERALVHFPRSDRTETLLQASLLQFWTPQTKLQRRALSIFVERDEEYRLRRFIDFCIEGGFTIR